jgi:predicted PP-loop superfamily ATPase
VVCRKAASAIHHYSYDENTLQGGDLSQLFPICDRCHKKVEFTKKGQKRTLEQAQQVFLQLRGHPPIKTKQLPKKQRLTRIRLPSRKQRRATPEGCRQLMMEKKEQIKAKIAQLQAELAELEKW